MKQNNKRKLTGVKGCIIYFLLAIVCAIAFVMSIPQENLGLDNINAYSGIFVIAGALFIIDGMKCLIKK